MTKWWFLCRVLGIHILCLSIIWSVYQSLPRVIPDTQVNNVEVVSSTTTPQISIELPLQANRFATSTVFFTGDVMLARQVEYLLTINGADYSFKNLHFLQSVPAYVVGNFEASIPVIHKKTPDFGYTFSVNKKFVPALKNAALPTYH